MDIKDAYLPSWNSGLFPLCALMSLSPHTQKDSASIEDKDPASVSEDNSPDFIDPFLNIGEQRRLWRGLDLRILPLVSLLYLLSFM